MIHLPDIALNFTAYAETYGYVGVFVFFLIIDELIPLPDEISLITLGYLCTIGALRYPLLAGVAAFAAFMLVDAIEFLLARKGSRLVRKLQKKANQGWLERYKQKLHDNLPKTLLVLSFIPRMRVFGPLLVGVTHVPARRFFLYDALSLGLFILVYMSLGFFFHNAILNLFDHLHETIRHAIFGGLMIILLFVLAVVNNIAGKRTKKNSGQ